MFADLPITAILPEVLDALRSGASAVLVAPPGAGKTTAVAPALLKEAWCRGQILITSPRRVAARAAAERMADMFGEPAGETVGYLTRLDSKRTARTRIVVMTEGIFVNRIIEDPELAGVSAVLFDEVHERHLDTDFGLALALESQEVLRPDLRILPMSATIDGARFSTLLGRDAPIIESAGQAQPLEIVYVGTGPTAGLEDHVVAAVRRAVRERDGDALVFLPGVREIERVREKLEPSLPGMVVLPLHGQIEPAAQRRAIQRDAEGRRRIVLATAIAETSLTLDGVRIVIDSGLSRQAVFDRTAGTTHLVTRRASQASAAQRAGRAARQGPGVAYRLWEEASHAGRPPFDPPEIATADLAPLVLRAAQWGSNDLASLRFLDLPPAAGVAAARDLLRDLRALDDDGRITADGRRLSALPLHPQAAAMVLFGSKHGAGEAAAQLAYLLQEPGLGGRDEDLEVRWSRWLSDRGARAQAGRAAASRWARSAGGKGQGNALPAGVLLAAGRPAFIARRRDDSGEQWLSAGGRGFALDPASPLARSCFLVIGDAQGQAKGARITAAIALNEADIDQHLGQLITRRQVLQWAGGRVEARRERRLGHIVFAQGPDPEPDTEAILALLVEKALGSLEEIIPNDLLARFRFAGLAAAEPGALREMAALWLSRLLQGRRDLALAPGAVMTAILDTLDWSDRRRLDTAAPREFVSPAGTRHVIDYIGDDAPSVEVRVQALFGLDRHPMVGQSPLLVKVTSPAGRPLQATRDLPGFWRGSWRDVQREMKGRYPRHRWPDEPWREQPSLKTKNAFQRGRA